MPKLTVLHDTYFKYPDPKKFVLSAEILDQTDPGNTLFVPKGSTFKVHSYSQVNAKYYKVAFNQFVAAKRNTWAVYMDHVRIIDDKPKTLVDKVVTKLKVSKISQPDSQTCQATCICMALGLTANDVPTVRQKLIRYGTAGDPGVMARVIRELKPASLNYRLNLNASLSDAVELLKNGAFLITHGWWTPSGHVICLDGIDPDPNTLSIKFNVSDPWSKFNEELFKYDNLSIKFYDGYYSSRLLYATAVAGASYYDAENYFRSDKLNMSQKGAWLHIFE